MRIWGRINPASFGRGSRGLGSLSPSATPGIPKASVNRLSATVVGVLKLGIVIAPAPANAQSVEWTAGPALLFDTDFVDGTEIGPGLFLDVLMRSRRTVSYFASVSAARTDFPVSDDQVHRNFGAAALGLRVSAGSEARVGVLLGMGALVSDDVSETDPDFRSSANYEELLLAGIEVGVPVGRSLLVRLSIRDQITGWWWRIWDPAEGALSHRFILTLGLGRGG